MLTLNDGRSELWQWDTGRTLTVDAECSQVHFSNKVFGRSLDVDVIDGVAAIPDILLQTDKELTAWAFVGTAENGYTKISNVFKVNRRNKPADYVFTPTDQTTLDDILDRIEDLEKRPSGGNGGITKEVDPTVPDWAKQPQKPTYTAAEVGALPDTTKIPSTAEDVGALPANAFIPKTAADVGAIPVPETATVGQTIVVKEVDESGKPTRWECVDVAVPEGDGWTKIGEVVFTGGAIPIADYTDGTATIDSTYGLTSGTYFVRKPDYSGYMLCVFTATETDGVFTVKDHERGDTPSFTAADYVVETLDATWAEIMINGDFRNLRVRLTTPCAYWKGARTGVMFNYANFTFEGANWQTLKYKSVEYEATTEASPLEGYSYSYKTVRGGNGVYGQTSEMSVIVTPAVPNHLSIGHYNGTIAVGTKVELWGKAL